MFCKNCGKQLADNANFCANCGTPVAFPTAPQEAVSAPVVSDPFGILDDMDAGQEAAETSATEAVPPQEEVPASGEDTPVQDGAAPQEPTAEPTEEPAANAVEKPAVPVPASGYGIVEAAGGPVPPITKPKGHAAVFVVLGIAAVIIIGLIVLAVKVLPGLFGGGGQVTVAYLNDDDELMYLANLKEKTQPLELTGKGGYSTEVAFSPDGKTVYFTDEDDTLYAAVLSELKKGGKAQRISRNVNDFLVLKDGRVAYEQYDNGLKLSIYEKGESYRLLKNYSNYQFSEDQKTVYYTESDDSGNTRSLYRVKVSQDAKEERLLKGASTIYTSYDADVLVYGVEDLSVDYDSGSNTLTVYSCKPGGDKTKLVGDVYSVTDVSVDGSKVNFYYYTADVDQRTLYDFVTDNKAREDADILNGSAMDYPSWSDYTIDEIWIDDDATEYAPGVVYYTNGTGEHCPIDASSLLNGTGRTLSDLYNMYWDLYDIAYEDSDRRYDEAAAKYEQWYENWWEASNREDLRESLKNSTYNQSSLSLYHYTGSDKSEPIATLIDQNRSRRSADGVFLYHKIDLEDGKLADLADLYYAGEVYDLLDRGIGDEEWYQNVAGKESVIDLDDITSVYGMYVLNGKEVVLDVSDGQEESLLAFSIGKDSLTYTASIFEGDLSGPWKAANSSGSDVLYLFTDTDEENMGTVGDFCVYKGGKLETIAKEVYGAIILDDSGTTYVVPEIDSRSGGELALLKGGKTVTVTDEIDDVAPVFLDGTQMLFVSDGDLTLWDGKQTRRIARDVEQFWTNRQESYRMFDASW